MSEKYALFFLGFKAEEALTPKLIERIEEKCVLICSTPFGKKSEEVIGRFISANKFHYASAIGFCGGIRKDIEIGDILTPSEAHYRNSIAYPFSEFRIKNAKHVKIETVDSIEIETPYFLKRMQTKKIDAVDMELFHFFAKCSKAKIKSDVALVVSDIPVGNNKSFILIPEEAANKAYNLVETYLHRA